MEAVIFCGIQGAGKSTFFRNRFFDTHVRINMDMLRTRHRERLLLNACIEGKTRFVSDNTNPTAADRAPYSVPAKAAGFRIIGYYFSMNVTHAVERNAARPGSARIPPAGLFGDSHPAEGSDRTPPKPPSGLGRRRSIIRKR